MRQTIFEVAARHGVDVLNLNSVGQTDNSIFTFETEGLPPLPFFFDLCDELRTDKITNTEYDLYEGDSDDGYGRSVHYYWRVEK